MTTDDHYLKKELYALVREDSAIFDFLQNGSLDGIWYWDLEQTDHEWMSPAFWTTLGYDPKKRTHFAAEWQDLIHPEDLKVALDNFNRHLADPAHPYDQVVRYRHRDGSTVWVRCRGMAIRDKTGKPLRMLGAHTDLTEQKRTEEALTRQKTIESDLANLASFLLTTTDLETVSRRVLDIAATLTGARYGYVGSIDPETRRLTCQAMTPNIPPTCGLSDEPIHFGEFTGLWGWSLDRHEPILVNDPGADPRSAGVPSGHFKIDAFLGMPAMIGEFPVGQIALANPEDRFSDEDLTIVQRIATLYALAIQRQRYETGLVAAEAEKTAELERLVEKRTRDLSHSREMLQKVFSSQLDAIFVMDNASPPVILDCNPAAEALFGHGRDEMIGRTTAFLHLDADHLSAFQGKLYRQIEETGGSRLDEFQMKHKSGALLHVEITVAQLLDEQGARMGWISAIHDVGDRKKLETAVRESEEKFRTVAEFNYDWEVWTAPGGEFLYVSPSCERITGYPREAFFEDGALMPRILHPDDRDWAARHFENESEDENVHKLDFRIVTRKGDVRWISHYCQPVYNEHGEYLGRRGSNRDITDRKGHEEKLIENEARFRELFDNMSSGVAIYHSPDGGERFFFKDLNRSGLEYSRRKKSEVLGREVREVFPGVEEMKLYDVFKRVWRTGVPEHHPVSIYQDQRVEQWVENYVCKLPTGELVAIYEDTTARKRAEIALEKSEERLKLALDSVSDAVWDWRIDTGEIHFSSRWFTMLGYEPDEFPHIYETWRNLLHPDDRDRAEKTVLRHLDLAETFEMEFRMRTKDNGWKWILGRGKTVEKDDQGHAARMLGTHMDITERKRVEAQLQQSQKMEAIGTLAGGIAHDFNNILNPIIGFTEFILEDDDPGSPQTMEFVQIIHDAGLRARDLVKQILVFSRKKDVEVAPCDLSAITWSAIKFLRSSMPVTIDFDVEITDSLIAMADGTKFHQVVMNLFTNAGHAMGPTGGRLSVRLEEAQLPERGVGRHPVLPPGAYAKLTVADTGGGIAEEHITRIFDPFFTTKSENEGTGLGLSVAHAIIKELKGDILVESQVGKGTAFHVYLPLFKTSRKNEEWRKTDVPTGTERILFVDDEIMTRTLVQKVLGSLGYRVTTAANGREGLDRFREDPDAFDLVVSDMTMPKMTGDEMIQQIKTLRPDIPAIICTGYSEKTAEESVRKIGIDAIVAKPIERTPFANAVRRVLDGRGHA